MTTKHIMNLNEAKNIYVVFFKRISPNKIRKMQEFLTGSPKRRYLFPRKFNKRFGKTRIDLRISHCHMSRRNWSNGLNYTRKRCGKRKLKIVLFFCYAGCGNKFLGYCDGFNQRQYCHGCVSNQIDIEDYELRLPK